MSAAWWCGLNCRCSANEIRCGAGSRRSGLQRWYFLDLGGQFALGAPSIIGTLHPHPDTSSIAKKLAKTNRYRRRNRLTLLKDVVQVLAGNTEKRRDLGLGLAGRRDDLLAQQLAGMSGAPVRIALGGILGHGSAPQWYCSKSTRTASPASNSKVMHHGPLTWTVYRVGTKPFRA